MPQPRILCGFLRVSRFSLRFPCSLVFYTTPPSGYCRCYTMPGPCGSLRVPFFPRNTATAGPCESLRVLRFLGKMHMRVPAGPRSPAFYTTPRLGYTMLIKGRCVTPGAGQAEWNNTVAWTIVQMVCNLPSGTWHSQSCVPCSYFQEDIRSTSSSARCSPQRSSTVDVAILGETESHTPWCVAVTLGETSLGETSNYLAHFM